MGDAENTLPPSKKRAAGRELSRDNPGLDDEEEFPGQETGTFKRASDEVLANRRIVRVRRSQPSSAPSAPSSNPFAAIRLVPPADPSATPAATNNVQEITVSEEAESPSSVNKKTEKGDDDDAKKSGNKVDEAEAVQNTGEEEGDASEVKNSESTNAEVAKGDDSEAKEDTENEAKKETESKEVESDGNKDGLDGNAEKNTAAASVSSFQQLSSSQNAFTGLVGTGFSSSTFSFGSIPKSDQPSSQNAFTGLVGTGFSSSTFSFGSIPKSDQPAFPSFSFGANGNSSLFDKPAGASLGDKAEGIKIPSMQEVHVETGEENEKAVFTADSVLFEFLDGSWKERGKGELKVNVLTTGTKKARLVMRARGNYRLILNASIFPDMKLANMDKKGITFACLNSTGEGKDGLSTFALKFKDASIVEEFRSVVTEHKCNTATAAPILKTPENSPKASDE